MRKTGIHFFVSRSSGGYDALHHRAPVAARLLPEQPHRRIPGGIFAIEQPAPIGNFLQQQEGRAAKRAGKMRHRRIAGDDEIERLHHRRRIDEGIRPRVEISAQRLDLELCRRRGEFIQPIMLLQADEAEIPRPRQRGESR